MLGARYKSVALCYADVRLPCHGTSNNMASEDRLDRGASVSVAAYDATEACRHRGNNCNNNHISVQPLRRKLTALL